MFVNLHDKRFNLYVESKKEILQATTVDLFNNSTRDKNNSYKKFRLETYH